MLKVITMEKIIMRISTEEIDKFLLSTEGKEHEIYDVVGLFPKIKVGNEELPEGNIVLKNGYQNPSNIHSGYGVIHILKGSHTNDLMYSNVTCLDDLVKVIKNALKKHSKIYMEMVGDCIVISNMNTQKVVVEYRGDEGIYSVVTCHSITKSYNPEKKHGDNIGKIKDDLTNMWLISKTLEKHSKCSYNTNSG